jgi:two-component system chemotaxis response regulator CheB
MIKTLIVDDSPLVRVLIKDFLESDDGFAVIGEAENGLEGAQKARSLQPDLITMDIEMPVMNGLEAIEQIMATAAIPIVVISTQDTAKIAYEATVKGALEFFAKDNFTSAMSSEKRTELLETLKRISRKKAVVGKLPGLAANRSSKQMESREILGVIIASSTGGPKALTAFCSALPGEFPVPIILVQHNSPGFDQSFVQWLNEYTPLEVQLAEEGEIPRKGKIYVAPTGRHLLWTKNGFHFDNGGPVNNQKPAADLLFKSSAEFLGAKLISVVLTGMGEDGAEGPRYVRQAGGITIAQDEESSMIYGMPKAAYDTGCVDMVLPLERIPPRLIDLTRW